MPTHPPSCVAPLREYPQYARGGVPCWTGASTPIWRTKFARPPEGIKHTMHAHWMDSDEPLDAETLCAEGLTYRRLGTDPAAYQGPLDAIKEAQGYVKQDEIVLGPDTPNLDAVCAKFWDEHRHTEDEVRFVLEGEGQFDVRSRDDRWMRVVMQAGDLIVVPKDRHHRFALTEKGIIRCVRLFKDMSGWTAIYRPEARM